MSKDVGVSKYTWGMFLFSNYQWYRKMYGGFWGNYQGTWLAFSKDEVNTFKITSEGFIEVEDYNE